MENLENIENHLDNIATAQASLADSLSTLVNDLSKSEHYRDMNMKEQNRHLARIATALEKLVGGTNLGVHVERYQAKLDAEQTSEDVQTAEFKQALSETKEQAKTYTHDDLKALCMSKSREDTANKAKLKALLSSYGASKASDVQNSKLAEIIAKIESGEF